jgi:DNA-binding transcriptional MerR regulator
MGASWVFHKPTVVGYNGGIHDAPITSNQELVMNQFIDISQAARMSGKSKSTIKRWASQSLISSQKDESGHWFFDPESIKYYLAKSSVHEPAMTDPQLTHTKPHDHVLTIENHLRTVHESLQRERQINDELRKKIEEKDSEILKLIHEMKSLLQRDSGGNILSRWLRS